MKTRSYINPVKALAAAASVVVLSTLWVIGSAQAENVANAQSTECSGFTVLDKTDERLDMKLMVHRPYGAPMIVSSEI